MLKTAILSARHLKACTIAASDEETRYYLNGVCVEIEPRQVRYIATDGHVLFMCMDTLDKGEPDNTALGAFIIPNETAQGKKLGLKARDYSNNARLNLTIESATRHILALAGVPHVAEMYAPIDGTFPAWRRVLPQGTASGEAAMFAPDKLLAAQKCFGVLLDEKKPVAPTMHFNGPNDPTFATRQKCEAFAVVMPMRAPKQTFMPDIANLTAYANYAEAPTAQAAE